MLRQCSLLFLLISLFLAGCTEPPKPTVNLYRAIHTGDLDQIKRHLYWGTDINQPGPDGNYPLHVAARRGRVVIARKLIEQGARVDVPNGAGETPMEVALKAGKVQVADLLLQSGAKPHSQQWLFMLATAGISDRDVFAFVVAQGADLDGRDDAGRTPLHVAVAEGQRLVVKRLLQLGAPVNASDNKQRTPLDLALASGARDIIQLLQSYGARRGAQHQDQHP